MKCTIAGCPGEYEPRRVVQAVERAGQTTVIENIPAEVCTICGDTLLAPDTVRAIEQLLASPAKSAHTVPALTFPTSGVGASKVSG